MAEKEAQPRFYRLGQVIDGIARDLGRSFGDARDMIVKAAMEGRPIIWAPGPPPYPVLDPMRLRLVSKLVQKPSDALGGPDAPNLINEAGLIVWMEETHGLRPDADEAVILWIVDRQHGDSLDGEPFALAKTAITDIRETFGLSRDKAQTLWNEAKRRNPDLYWPGPGRPRTQK